VRLLLKALLGLALCWAPLVASQDADAAGERRFAVIIGANQGDLADAPLLYAERDAERMAEVLSQLAGVYEEDVVLLRSPDTQRVTQVISEVGRRAARAQRDPDQRSLLFFYYSGHADADAMHLGTSRLDFDSITAAIEALPVDVRILIVDACRSGELTRVKGGVPAEPFEITVENQLSSNGMAIITSSSAGEDAQESDRLRGGVSPTTCSLACSAQRTPLATRS